MTLKKIPDRTESEMSQEQDINEENEEIKKFKSFKEKEHFNKKRKFETDYEEKFSKQRKMANTEGEKPDWKKVKQEKKELKLKRKQSATGSSEVYELSMKAKKIWEVARREDCKGAKKYELCKELYDLIKGKVKSLIYAHDTVRVIETLVSSGGDDLRTLIFEELKDELLNLSKNKYSRFFVVKLLRHGTKEQKNAIINSMLGKVVKLMHHKIASDVLELAYNDYANAKQRSHMIQEFYGSRFKYFKEEITTLNEALQKFPELKEKIMSEVTQALQPILTKGVFTNVLVHTLLKEYLYVCEEEEKRNVIDTLKEHLLPILHTRDGARVAMLCIWNGTAKDKKVILKSFKENFTKIALEEHGHMVLLAAFDSTDDTVFVSKAVLAELMGNINLLVGNENAKKVLKYLVAPRSKLFFHPHVLSVLEEGDKFPHSKKERSVKYKELQEYIAKPVLKLLHENINNWARDSHWTLFVGAALQSLSHESIIPIFEALAEICAETFLPGEEKHFLEVSYMVKLISFVIQCDKVRFQENKPYFSSYLIEAAEPELKGWSLVNRGCFALVKLIETEIPEVSDKVISLCMPIKSKLRKLTFPGADVLCRKLDK